MNEKQVKKIKAIEFQTISYCNSTCVVCPWRRIKHSYKKAYMNGYVWEKVLEGISKLKPEVVIPYMNNEPLLDESIELKIDDVRRLNLESKIEVSTNGMLLTDEISNFLVNKVDYILISLFGGDEFSNSRVMGENMSYNRVKNNIITLNKIKEKSKSNSTISIVKLKNNPFMSNKEVLMDREFWEQEIGVKIYYYDFVDRSTNVADFQQRDNLVDAFGCYFNRHLERTYIHHDGQISFCCHDWEKKYIMGNLMKNSLVDILNGEKYGLIRDKVNGIIPSGTNFICKKCLYCKTTAY